MNFDPRDPLHQPRTKPRRVYPKIELPSEAPAPDSPKPNIPDYGDTPNQVPQVEAGAKSEKKG